MRSIARRTTDTASEPRTLIEATRTSIGVVAAPPDPGCQPWPASDSAPMCWTGRDPGAGWTLGGANGIGAGGMNGGALPVNIKFFIEGEEEVGSTHLDDFVRMHKQELAADVVVISDSPMFDRGIPSICYGLRGLAYFQIDLRGTRTDLHSGSFGGAVANPALVLAQILAQMKDRGGRVKIPGFRPG